MTNLEVPKTVMPAGTPRGPLRRGCPFVDGLASPNGRVVRRQKKAQQHAADRAALRRIVTAAGATPRDLARLTDIAEAKWRRWLRGDRPTPPHIIEYLEAAFLRMPEGDPQNRIDSIRQLQECFHNDDVPSVFEIPVDPAERAEMRRKVEIGAASMRSLSGMRRPLDPDEQHYLLQELAKPYPPTAG